MSPDKESKYLCEQTNEKYDEGPFISSASNTVIFKACENSQLIRYCRLGMGNGQIFSVKR